MGPPTPSQGDWQGGPRALSGLGWGQGEDRAQLEPACQQPTKRNTAGGGQVKGLGSQGKARRGTSDPGPGEGSSQSGELPGGRGGMCWGRGGLPHLRAASWPAAGWAGTQLSGDGRRTEEGQGQTVMQCGLAARAGVLGASAGRDGLPAGQDTLRAQLRTLGSHLCGF